MFVGVAALFADVGWQQAAEDEQQDRRGIRGHPPRHCPRHSLRAPGGSSEERGQYCSIPKPAILLDLFEQRRDSDRYLQPRRLLGPPGSRQAHERLRGGAAQNLHPTAPGQERRGLPAAAHPSGTAGSPL